MPAGRRWPRQLPRLTGRPWEDVAQGLEEFLRRLYDSETEGIPPGWGEDTIPLQVKAGALGDPGTEASGWAAADHEHGAKTGMPEAVSTWIAPFGGVSDALSRADHQHQVYDFKTVGCTIDAPSGGLVTPGFKGFVAVPFTGLIDGCWLKADQPGNVVVDVWKADRRPNVLNSICGANKPALVGEMESWVDISGWATEALFVEGGDIFGFYVDSVDTIALLTVLVEAREGMFEFDAGAGSWSQVW